MRFVSSCAGSNPASGMAPFFGGGGTDFSKSALYSHIRNDSIQFLILILKTG